jgi:translocation and assembly module TamA
MRLVPGLRAALAALATAAVLGLAGCANLPFLSGKSDAEAAAAAAAAPPTKTFYLVEVEAADPLRKLLIDFLDLSRFQVAPVTEAINDAEIDRLMRAAPAQARGLLETEGYFNAEVTVTRSAVGATGLPLVRVVVESGPRTQVAAVTVNVVGDLKTAAESGDENAARELTAVRLLWPLRVGDEFSQSAWNTARNGTLAWLRAEGFATANWSSSRARVDAPENSVTLALVLDSGPRFRLGAIRIEGLSRYDEESVRRLANFNIGDPYSEKLLLDFQERLQKVGLFEGASVELDADVSTAAAAPVLVRVKEHALLQTTIGVGFSDNTGARVSVETIQRRFFDSRWIAKNKFELGLKQQTWEGDLTSHPLDDLYRNQISGSATRLDSDDQILINWNARIGRTQDTPRIERRYFVELLSARLESAALTNQGDALSYNYHWIYRDVDSVQLPTQGLTANLQAGLGYSRGTQTTVGDPTIEAQGPFTRLYARLTWYEQLAGSWFGTVRLEAGEVFTRNVIGVPDTVLFRAGGEDSVRGYAYRSLGPSVDGTTTSGRNLLTGSVEIARPILSKYPAYWWAVFVDAGNAADGWTNLKPVWGYGVGLRWRSPVGPLRVDVAYGQETRSVRTTLSVGITF